MTEELLTCNHCRGTGTCQCAGDLHSCDGCRAMATNRAVVDMSALTLVSCSRCDGLGQRDLNYEQRQYSLQLQELASRPQPKVSTQANPTTAQEREQLKLVSEYIRFHMGLYLATPPVLVILAEGLGVTTSAWWIGCLLLMIVVYTVSGVDAGIFMGRFINFKWNPQRLETLKDQAYSPRRRFFHHWLYWGGLAIGIIGLILPLVQNWLTGQ